MSASTQATPAQRLLRGRGYTDADRSPAPKNEAATAGEKSIDEMAGKELDAAAAELGLDDWNAKAKVDEKKAALKAHLIASEPKPLEEATDEQLHAIAEEAGLTFTAETSREDLIATIRFAQSE